MRVIMSRGRQLTVGGMELGGTAASLYPVMGRPAFFLTVFEECGAASSYSLVRVGYPSNQCPPSGPATWVNSG